MEKLKKVYVAPTAQLMCFAPTEEIAADSWETPKGGWTWNPNGIQNFWGSMNATNSAVTTWYDFGTDELK